MAACIHATLPFAHFNEHDVINIFGNEVQGTAVICCGRRLSDGGGYWSAWRSSTPWRLSGRELYVGERVASAVRDGLDGSG